MDDPDSGDAPDVRNMAVTSEDHVYPKLPQNRHYVARVPEDVHIAPSTGNGEDMMMNHKYLRSPVPSTELRVKPAVVFPAHFALIQVRLGRVKRHDLGLALRHLDRDGFFPHPEELLEVAVTDVPGVVVAGDHDHVRTLYAVEVPLGLLEFPPVALRREVAGDDDEVRREVVRLLNHRREKVGPEEARSHVDVRHLHYLHLCSAPLSDYAEIMPRTRVV